MAPNYSLGQTPLCRADATFPGVAAAPATWQLRSPGRSSHKALPANSRLILLGLGFGGYISLGWPPTHPLRPVPSALLESRGGSEP